MLNVVKNVPGQQAIYNLYDNDIRINGKAERGIFNKLEIDDIYNRIGYRKYERELALGNTIATYNNWEHIDTEDGYSIWKYPIADFIDDTENELYYNDIVLTYVGESDSETTLTGMNKIFISNSKKSGATYFSASSTNLSSLSLASGTSVVNAVFSASNVVLPYEFILDGTVSIKSYDTLTSYIEGTDYEVDYEVGTIDLISGSDLYVKVTASASSFLVSYDIGNTIYIGMTSAVFDGFNITLSQNGLGNVYTYYYGSSSFVYFSDLSDYTNNFSVSGNVMWDSDELTGWTTKSVNGTSAYWIKVRLNSRGNVIPKVDSIYKSTTSISSLLSLTPSNLLNNEYKWGYYDNNIYVTIPNNGLIQNEGVTYIKSTSTANTKQNYFIYNNEYIINYKKTSDLSSVPTSASDTGIKGEIRFDEDYAYFCIDTNTWVRTQLDTWT